MVLIESVYPRRVVGGIHLLLAAATAAMVLLTATEDGATRLAFVAMTTGVLLGWTCWILVTLVPRSAEPPAAGADGNRVVEGRRTVSVLLIGAWLSLLVAGATLAWVAATDFDSIERPGATLVLVVGALGSLPDLFRLVTGRLHHVRLVLNRAGVRYQGFRTDWFTPWSEVSRVTAQATPPGVLIARSSGVSRFVPIAAFGLSTDQLAQVVADHR